MNLAAPLLAAVLAWLPAPAEAPRISLWRLDPGAAVAESGAPDQPMAVGSLVKPFLAKAWAMAHPHEASPRSTCAAGSGCWLPGGHGDLGLAGAVAVSCNTYFLRLAEATPMDVLATTLAAEGFQGRPRSARQCLGLEAGEGAPAITPSALLRAYVRLIGEPWPGAEPVRQQVLAGLREAALTGTAAGLGHRGFWAKTGTVAAGPLHTTGLALAVDASGWAILARLQPGRGIDAAQALAAPIDQFRPWARRHPAPSAGRAAAVAWTEPGAQVRVRLFELLHAQRYQVRNLGPDPVLCGNGYLGAGSLRELRPGDSAGPGLLAIRDPATGLERCFQGEVSCQARDGALALIARMAPREYVAGVIAAESPRAGSGLRLALGAAVLRFLAQGPRYPDAEVGDSTRTAYFIGRGPRPWFSPGHQLQGTAPVPDPGLSDQDWSAICAASRTPGPSQWTSDDGGRPLSAHDLWGGAPPAETRPGGPPSHPWTRTWSRAQLEQAFGAPVDEVAVAREDGVWVLRVRGGAVSRSYRYDQAHRRLAKVLGWGALPSPADTVRPVPGGFRADGVGLGHRVGLSLAASP
ncbi:MAG: hypothetical protein P4L36_19395 [Holophaga sp.]|nr:hypothetical protein [Holophaga sp.]